MKDKDMQPTSNHSYNELYDYAGQGFNYEPSPTFRDIEPSLDYLDRLVNEARENLDND